MKAIVLGLIASLFFATSFVLNRSMNLGGGAWMWSAVLRYVWMLPMLLAIVYMRGSARAMWRELRQHLWAWLGWSTVGFGLFYAPLCFAAAFQPAWLVASTWQLTIIAGSLLAPLLWVAAPTPDGPRRVRGRIPLRGIGFSLLIVLGVVVMQAEQVGRVSLGDVLLGALPVLLAAFAYPLGNRKMMELCGQRLDTFQRVCGMTIASMPFWAVLAAYGLATAGPPSLPQVEQSLVVAVCSGVVATLLFFRATDMAHGDAHRLAAVEATQSGEVVFTLLGEIVWLQGALPSAVGLAGIACIVVGMVAHSYSSHRVVRPA
ncbi:multidrug resistance efflux transporter family protein [Chloroflexia bacterium SDU3-3]|nr:multidrug resistance efflux transporter family protein [Chloroflexia bacterium SDU3-3]